MSQLRTRNDGPYDARRASDNLEAKLSLGQSRSLAGSYENDALRRPDRCFSDGEVFQPLLTWPKKQKRGEKAGWARRRSDERDYRL
jgi:hypothetical protein